MNNTSAIIELIKERLKQYEQGADAGDTTCWAVCDELGLLLKEIERLNQGEQKSVVVQDDKDYEGILEKKSKKAEPE